MTRVIGVDLSLTATGIATPDEVFTVKTTADQCDDERMSCIARAVLNAAAWRALVVLEGGSSHGTSAFRLGGLHYVVRFGLWDRSIPFAVVSPSTLKKFATGSGRGEKSDMRMAWRERSGVDPGSDDNQVDAMWLRYAGLVHLGLDLPFTLPKAQVDALTKAEWPA